MAYVQLEFNSAPRCRWWFAYQMLNKNCTFVESLQSVKQALQDRLGREISLTEIP